MTAFDFIGARKQVLASSIPPPLKLVLLVLIEHMPDCYAGLDRLAAESSTSRRTIIRSIARLERMAVLRVERATGRSNRYHLRPVEDWRPHGADSRVEPVPTEGTRARTAAPVADTVTGDNAAPVPPVALTRANEGAAPVPPTALTRATVTPEAVLGGSPKAGSEAGRARGVFAGGVVRTFTMPSEEPTQSYLDSALMAGVKPEQARSTWSHYVGKGLPLDGVERLEWWLVQRAKERQNQLATVPKKAASSAAPARPGDDLDTTGAATAFRATSDHRDFAAKHLKGHDLQALVAVYRRSAETERIACSDHQRDFLHRLHFLARTGKFVATGPLPKLPPGKPAAAPETMT